MPPATAPLDAFATDDELLDLTSGGDKGAFSALYERTAPRILGLIQRVLVDPAQSEEVAQDVFLEVWQNAARFDPDKGHALSWMLTMAHRRAIDRVRASQSSRDRDYAVGVRDHRDDIDDPYSDVETRLEHTRVAALLSQLTIVQQEAITLTYFEGLTNTEAARKAGIPVGTMKTRLRGSLIALRAITDEAA